jgi:hypothetical protein
MDQSTSREDTVAYVIIVEFRAPDLVVPGSKSALPHHRQVLTRRPYLSE